MGTQVDVQPGQGYSEQFAAVLEQFNRKMEDTANAAVAFAPPLEHDGLTVIPVAKVGWRFGGGTGTGRPKQQEQVQGGTGIGGTMSVSPVGYIEVKGGTARFRPIFTPDAILKMQIVGGFLALGILRRLGTAFKRRQPKKGERKRESVFNVVFSPGANIITREGRVRKPRQGSQSRRHLNERKTQVRLPHPTGTRGSKK